MTTPVPGRKTNFGRCVWRPRPPRRSRTEHSPHRAGCRWRLRGRPSDVFKRHCFLTPYPEDDIPRLIEYLGPDNVLFGSDFPHPEGVSEPAKFIDLLGPDASDEATHKVMRDNTGRLLGLV